ncbi:tRNA dihydrouridine synthase DusB [uncultured Sphaerochaeta sp.]|uniref:tRNA dihydrouridine synthase DusB n=1 Tax=uncultured Sphaerochaeta sp. TaxID=886478 RepID=UPI002A0A6CDE|nr:tRNA dihydrouridine synthase DusB [uncultured Sphaerochaeta sp.]
MNENSLYHNTTVGDTTIKGNIFLAPMAGFTDVPFRSLCIDEGADLTFTEMVSAEGLSRDGEKTMDLMKRAQNEQHYAIQLFMGSPEPLEKALERLLPYNPTLIDINCGCPVPKVTKTGAGSSIMRNPEMITKMVRLIVETVSIPVSVKFRTGWDADSENFLAFAQAALDGGASLLTLHARTKAQGYAPFAHWEKLTELKNYCVSHGYQVPVFGSGDLFTASDAKKMLEQTGIDGVMFARGAIGNPFIFVQTKELLAGQDLKPISLERKKAIILKHLDLMIIHYGEKSACMQMRKHACSYLKGLPGIGPIKQAFVKATSKQDYCQALEMLGGTC